MKMFRDTRMVALTALLSALVIAAPVGAASAVAAQAAPSSNADGVGGGGNPGSYANPLAPEVPGDGVGGELRRSERAAAGQRAGDTNWYLYCTTDPLNDEDVDANGDPVFRGSRRWSRRISSTGPTWASRSRAPPSWAEPDAALWAPDVVYSSTFDQYYMFVVGHRHDQRRQRCRGLRERQRDRRRHERRPDRSVDILRHAGRRATARAASCNFLWTYDPDVLGDTVADSSILYYGSYYGGVYGTSLQLTADGATADTAAATMVAIDNKYEGANVVEKDGYYYLFALRDQLLQRRADRLQRRSSAGRPDPLGPFVDREGVSSRQSAPAAPRSSP